MKRVMVVDDSLMMRVNLKRFFEKKGYEVVGEAANGQEAVEKYAALRPDLVTMDITMPVMDGIAALERIRTDDPGVCVIMISALGQELRIIDALNKGARHYIVKPFEEKTVESIVTAVLSTQGGS